MFSWWMDGWMRKGDEEGEKRVRLEVIVQRVLWHFGSTLVLLNFINARWIPNLNLRKLLLCWRCGFLKCHENKRTIPTFSIHPHLHTHTISNDRFTAWMGIFQANAREYSVPRHSQSLSVTPRVIFAILIKYATLAISVHLSMWITLYSLMWFVCIVAWKNCALNPIKIECMRWSLKWNTTTKNKIIFFSPVTESKEQQ